MVQVPAAVRWTVVADAMLQLPLAPKLTVRPDVAVALTEKSAAPYVLAGSAAKLMVWLPLAMLKLRGTSGAAL